MPDGSSINSGIFGVSSGGGGGGGTVTSVSVSTANGFAGTVANASTTPAITMQTTITGLLKGNGTAISAAVSGTDYSAGTSGLATGILKSTTGTGALTIAAAGTDYPATGVITAGGPTGSATVVPVITYNANGQLTAVTTANISTTFPPFTTVAVSATGNSAASTFELVTTAASTITRTLPAPAANMIIAFKKVDSGAGTVVITQHAAEKIDGANTFTISTQYASINLISDGTNWFIW